MSFVEGTQQLVTSPRVLPANSAAKCAQDAGPALHTCPVQPRDRFPTTLLSDPGGWRAEVVHRQAQVPVFTKQRLEDVSSHSRPQGPSPSTLTPLCLKYKAAFIVA